MSISDVHLGRGRIDPSVIPNHLRQEFLPHLTDEVDLLCISGDFFDRPLVLGSQAANEAIMLIHEIVNLSEQHDFLIRIIRGTTLHDRKQNWYFNVPNVSKDRHGNERVKIYDDIEVEFIKGLDVSMLYIPDDLPHQDVLVAVQNKLAACGISRVTFCMHHGYFNYLLPKNIPIKPHNTLNEDLLEGMVEGCILNGHVHTASTYKRIINNGSFDRLAHNEEEKKGFFKIQYDPDTKKTSYQFIENKQATIFKTIDVCNVDVEKATQLVRLFIEQYNAYHEKVFLRILDDTPAKRHTLKKLVGMCKSIVIDFNKGKNCTTEDDMKVPEGIEWPQITIENLPTLIHEYCIAKNTPLPLTYITEKVNG